MEIECKMLFIAISLQTVCFLTFARYIQLYIVLFVLFFYFSYDAERCMT